MAITLSLQGYTTTTWGNVRPPIGSWVALQGGGYQPGQVLAYDNSSRFVLVGFPNLPWMKGVTYYWPLEQLIIAAAGYNGQGSFGSLTVTDPNYGPMTL